MFTNMKRGEEALEDVKKVLGVKYKEAKKGYEYVRRMYT